MDYLFLFLISTGFAKGVFRSLKSATKSLIAYALTIVVFSLVFFPIKDFVLSLGLFENEFQSFVLDGLSANKELSFVFQSKAELVLGMEKLKLPKTIIQVLLAGCKEGSVSIGGLIAKLLYQFLCVAIVGIALYVVISIFVGILVSFLFAKVRGGEGMFVTKRFLSGGISAVKGCLIFLTIETALLAIAGVLNIGFLQDFVLSSAIGKVGRFLVQPSIDMFVNGML